MIFVTGDTHGRTDIAKLEPRFWPLGQRLTRDDFLVICGDFGAYWDGGARDRAILDWYESYPWTTLWVDGNHENFDLIDALPVSTRFGGRVQVDSEHPHVIHLMRGEVYDLPVEDGITARAFVMGGAPSIDRAWRTEGVSWWPQEMPSDEEYANAVANLERADWSVDFVFTHEVPRLAMVDALAWDYEVEGADPETTELDGFLQYVDDKLDAERLSMWYAGHYHIDREVMDEQHCVLYDAIVQLGCAPFGF